MSTATTLPKIAAIEQEIVKEFALLQEEPALLLDHLIKLGEALPNLTEQEKIDIHLVPGCLAKVWLLPEYTQSKLFLRGDSNAKITKGLVSLAIRLFSGQSLQAIRQTPITLLHKTGLDQLLTAQRQGGFSAMVGFIHKLAAHHK